MLGKDRFQAIRHRKPAGRPRGEVADAVVEIIESAGPLTARDIAHRLQLTVNVVKFTCSRLHARGDITVADTIRVTGSNRPVSRYAAIRGHSFLTTNPQPHSIFSDRFE